jgi:hypothetical protein
MYEKLSQEDFMVEGYRILNVWKEANEKNEKPTLIDEMNSFREELEKRNEKTNYENRELEILEAEIMFHGERANDMEILRQVKAYAHEKYKV